MEKEKRSSMIFGRYNDKIENGAISIPWLKSKVFKKPCYYTVGQYNNNVHIYVHCNALDDDLLLVVDSGECAFDKSNKWLVPKSVLDIIGENECVWLGIGTHAELITDNRLNETELNLDELREAMLKLF